jgi:hypothetical protein
MDRFINKENIKNFKKRLENPKDEEQRETLVRLLAEEQAKSERLANGKDQLRSRDTTSRK